MIMENAQKLLALAEILCAEWTIDDVVSLVSRVRSGSLAV